MTSRIPSLDDGATHAPLTDTPGKGIVAPPEHLRRRVVIERVRPDVDDGRFPIKRVVGEAVEVTADIFADGHDPLSAVIRYRRLPTPWPDQVRHDHPWQEIGMTPLPSDADRWRGEFIVDGPGWYEYAICAWANQAPALASHSRGRLVRVDRARAGVGAWYEMFPRSAGPDPGRSGTFREAAALLPRIADLGFDVVYLPPIHPIGHSFRKGSNNAMEAGPNDPGSPWAIGSFEGGHTAIEPGLGTIEDFLTFRAEAERLGLEVALDLAWHCSPDHPWIHEHPEWFRHRSDGSIQYAENPPKKYQDIYPFDFTCENWQALWQELLHVTLLWVERGVRIFRADNPHTKVFGFWEWLIAEVQTRYPDVIFLSEAFTRPRVMQYLAKAGFTQSYTYFTWRNSKSEITTYLTELTSTEVREYLRPNLFTNTPDILHAYLQEGGRPAFEARLLLAATLGASYGIYSGFELCEGRAVPGTEEYADSEKYQYRKWDWHRAERITELVARVNAIRREHRAFSANWTLRFHATDNPALICYSKRERDGSNLVLIVVNLDPHHMQHGWAEVPLDAAALTPNEPYVAHDLLDDARYLWRGAWNYVRLDPGIRQGHIFQLEKAA